MRKNKRWILLSVLLLLAACGQEVSSLGGGIGSGGAPRPLPAVTAAAGDALEAHLPPTPGADQAPGRARPAAIAPAEMGQQKSVARVPGDLPTRAAATQTPTPSPTPTRTPSPTATPTTLPPTAFPTTAPTQGDGGAAVTSTAPVPTPTRDFSSAPTPMPTVPAAASKDVVHFLLIGLDHSNRAKVELTDVMIVAVVNKETGQVSLLSIPRDLWVYIPTYGYARINMAHKLGYLNDYPGGGPALLSETIRINLGIPMDHWARIDFEGFATAVDELGGVDLIVHCPVDLQYRSTDSGESRIMEPGEYHLDGETALRYVRTRRDGTDFDRARRQHQFLKAVWDQTRAPGLIGKIPGLWSALKGTFETDLNLGDVLGLAPLALEVKPESVRSRYIAYKHTIDWTTDKGWRVLLPKPEEIQKLVASLYAPPAAVESGEPGARIAVENGTWQEQMGLVAADRLRWEGFKVVETRLAAERGQANTQLFVYRDRPADVDRLVSLLGLKRKNVIYQPDEGAEADMLVVLGADYHPCR